MRMLSIRRIHCFHSPLSPDEVGGYIALEVRKENTRQSVCRENAPQSGYAVLKLKEKGGRVALYRTEIFRREGVRGDGYISGERIGFHIGAGISKEWHHANPFYGRCLPDGKGGTILRGKIGLHPGAWAFFLGIGILMVILGTFLDRRMWFVLLLLIWQLIRGYLRAEHSDISQRVLIFLEQCFSAQEE